MRLNSILACLCLGAMAGAAVAEERNQAPDDASALMQFNAAYEALQSADAAREAGQRDVALDRYDTAMRAYRQFAVTYPDWQPRVVEFRLEYCINQFEALRQERPREPVSAPTTPEEPVLDSALPDVTATNSAGPADLDQLTRSAEACLQAGEAEQARTILLQAFELNPDDPRVRLLAGLAQCQLRRFDDANYVLAELVEEYPSNAVARVALAAAAFGAGRTEEARRELEQALVLAPHLHEAHYNLAQVLLSLPEPDREAAWKHYQRALELGASPDPRLAGTLATQPATPARESETNGHDNIQQQE